MSQRRTDKQRNDSAVTKKRGIAEEKTEVGGEAGGHCTIFV